jgi:Domain of unknown function (DUF4145)
MAAVMLLRKAAEELCEERGTKGADLWVRIQELRDRGIITDAQKQALDDLRFLGNGAAPVKAKTFEDIGKEDGEDGIMVTQEILRAVYQQEHILEAARGTEEE